MGGKSIKQPAIETDCTEENDEAIQQPGRSPQRGDSPSVASRDGQQPATAEAAIKNDSEQNHEADNSASLLSRNGAGLLLVRPSRDVVGVNDDVEPIQAKISASLSDIPSPVLPVPDTAGSVAASVATGGDEDTGVGARMADGGDGLGKGEVGEAEHSVEPILSTQSQAKPIAFNKSTHKRSRIKKGWLIKRLTGYSIAETEYGVSYLWVLSRKPDRTSADNSVYGLAGYFNWESLNNQDLLRKEKKAK